MNPDQKNEPISNADLGVDPHRLYPLEALAKLLYIKKRSLQEACAKGELRGIKKYRRWFVKGEWFITFLEEGEKNND